MHRTRKIDLGSPVICSHFLTETHVAFGLITGIIVVVDVATNQETCRLTGHRSCIMCITSCTMPFPDNSIEEALIIASSAIDGGVWLWPLNLSSLTPLSHVPPATVSGTFAYSFHSVRPAIAFSPLSEHLEDGRKSRLFAVGLAAKGNTIRLCRITLSDQCIEVEYQAALHGHPVDSRIFALRFVQIPSHPSSLLVSGSGGVRPWLLMLASGSGEILPWAGNDSCEDVVEFCQALIHDVGQTNVNAQPIAGQWDRQSGIFTIDHSRDSLNLARILQCSRAKTFCHGHCASLCRSGPVVAKVSKQVVTSKTTTRWIPRYNRLFSQDFQFLVLTLMCVHQRHLMAKSICLPIEIWFVIIEFLADS